jgi:hypothetical protein
VSFFVDLAGFHGAVPKINRFFLAESPPYHEMKLPRCYGRDSTVMPGFVRGKKMYLKKYGREYTKKILAGN